MTLHASGPLTLERGFFVCCEAVGYSNVHKSIFTKIVAPIFPLIFPVPLEYRNLQKKRLCLRYITSHQPISCPHHHLNHLPKSSIYNHIDPTLTSILNHRIPQFDVAILYVGGAIGTHTYTSGRLRHTTPHHIYTTKAKSPFPKEL